MSHPGPTDDERAAITYLRSPLAVRARCENVLARGLDGGLTHFAVDLDQIAAAAAEVAAVTRERYPTLQVPGHGRMNQLGAGDVDRVADLAAQMAGLPRMERARALVDLVLISVVLDTRAGDAWRYHEAATGQTLTGSEGLAVATLHAFAAGLFSAEKREPWRVDARRLVELDDGDLAAALQVGPDNPLVGLAGRAQLLRRLGSALRGSTWFPGARPGSLIDSLGALSRDGAVAAAELLGALLDGLGDVWPGAIALGGVPLGDVGRHPAAGGDGPGAGLVPFHARSQWLAYSLFEPLAAAGLTITAPGALTGLPEPRNGGLLVDTGVLTPRHAGVTGEAHAVDAEPVVEWRALTVALLDRVADAVRDRLGRSASELPLASVLEGGTAAAGRRLAATRRARTSPIEITSDGTVF